METKGLTQLVVTGTLWTLASTLLSKAVNVGAIFVILRNLSLYEYGLAELLVAIPPLFSIITLSGLTQVAVADIGVEKGRGDHSRVKGLFWSFLNLHLVLSFVASFFLFISAGWIDNFYGNESSGLIKLVSTFFILSAIRNIAGVLFQVNLEFKAQSLFSLFEEFAKASSIILFILVFDLRTEAIILGIVFSQLVTPIIFAPRLYSIYRSWGDKPTHKFPLRTFLSGHSRWSILINYLGMAGQNIRPWLIKFSLGTEAVALFSVAYGFFSQILSLAPLSKVIAPLLPQYLGRQQQFLKLLEKGVKYQLICFAGVGVVSYFLVPVVVGIIFPNYVGALSLFSLFLLMLIPVSFDSLFGPAFLAIKAQRSMFFASLYKNALTIILMPIGGLLFGILGAGGGLVFAHGLFVVERYRRLKYLIPGFRFSFKDFLEADEYDSLVLGKIRGLWKGVLGKFTFSNPGY